MEEETTTQWPQPELLCYKFGLEASRVHVVLNFPASTSRLPEGKQSNGVCQEWNEPWLFVRSRLGLLSAADSYLPPYPLPSHQPETATFSTPRGNGEFSLPPSQNIFLSETSFHRHIIANIEKNVLL